MVSSYNKELIFRKAAEGDIPNIVKMLAEFYNRGIENTTV